MFQEWMSFCTAFFTRMATLRARSAGVASEALGLASEGSNAPAVLDLPDTGSDHEGENGQENVSRAMRALQQNLNRGRGRYIRRGMTRGGS